MPIALDTNISTPASQSQPAEYDPQHQRSQSPQPLPRPPVSPISPSTSIAKPVSSGAQQHSSAVINSIAPPQPPPTQIPEQTTQQQATSLSAAKPLPQTQFIGSPIPLPLDIDDNTDAAALRAAISILQIQRDKSRRDIKTLQKLKHGLIEDPDSFTQELLAGKLREEKLPNDPLQATFNGSKEDVDDDDEDDEEVEDVDAQLEGEGSTLIQDAKRLPKTPQYPKIPGAQNVVRCPPVNWAKYHIAGEPLDRMHQEQMKTPTTGEPARHISRQQHHHPYDAQAMSRPAEHQVLAPYDPHRDRTSTVAEQMGIGVQTRRSSKKPEFGAA